MALRLLVLTAAIDPPPSVVITGRKALIGRGADCEVRLPDPSVSSHHATIRKRGENYILIDEFSSHGTGIARVGEENMPVWLAPESPRVLEDGERIFLGQIELGVVFEATEKGAPNGQQELASQLVRAGLLAAGLDPTEELIESTLKELTELEDELYEEPEEELPEPIGVAALEQDDRHPPWRTDMFVAAVALLIVAGCLFGLGTLSGVI